MTVDWQYNKESDEYTIRMLYGRIVFNIITITPETSDVANDFATCFEQILFDINSRRTNE